MFNFFPYIIKRAVRHWQLLLTLSLGVILATGLLASGTLLVDKVIQLGLRSALSDADPLMGNMLVTSRSVNFTEDEYKTIDKQFKGLMDENIGDNVSQTYQSIHKYRSSYRRFFQQGKYCPGTFIPLDFIERFTDLEVCGYGVCTGCQAG